MKKIIAYFNALSDQTRYAVLVVVIFLIILLDVVFLLLPQMNDIGNVNDKTKQLSEDTRQVKIDRQRLEALKSNLEKQRGELAQLSSKLHSAQEVPGILSTVSNIAKDSKVRIDELVPEYGQAELLKKANEGSYYLLPIVVKAKCGYHMFGHFLNALENEKIYFRLKDFVVQNQDADPKVHMFSMTMELVLLDVSVNFSKKP